ncbi:MAG TPA: hypothetical protein VH040_18915 [Usitatibacter sp.]|jgi:hypothetical protein|nr:hypothetical protein [Usitatibacter sp.]
MRLRDLARLSALAAFALPVAVFAQGTPAVDYTVVCVIGDRFTVADRNTDVRREGHQGYTFPLGSASVDATALAVVKDVLAERLPGANISLAVVREPAVFEAEEEVLGLTRETQPLIDALQPVLSRIKSRRIVLVSKTREPVDVHFDNRYAQRPGVIEGLGFYLDPGRRVQDTKTFEIVQGYVGVFANFRVSLVDQATGRLIDEERIAAVEAVRDAAKDPWNSMTPEQKVAAIKDLVTTQVRKVLPGLIERSR